MRETLRLAILPFGRSRQLDVVAAAASCVAFGYLFAFAALSFHANPSVRRGLGIAFAIYVRYRLVSEEIILFPSEIPADD